MDSFALGVDAYWEGVPYNQLDGYYPRDVLPGVNIVEAKRGWLAAEMADNACQDQLPED